MHQRNEFDRRVRVVDIVGSSMVKTDNGVQPRMVIEMNVSTKE